MFPKPKTAFLGTGNWKKKIVLIGPPLTKNNFKVCLSTSGQNFRCLHSQAKIKKGAQKLEKIIDSPGCRLSESQSLLFLCYLRKTSKGPRMNFAVAKNLTEWEKVGQASEIETLGALVSNYQFQGKWVFFYGQWALKLAFSKDLKKWQLNHRPIHEFNDQETAGLNIQIADARLVPKGILVLYFLAKPVDQRVKYSLRAAFFDHHNPRFHLLNYHQVIWEQPAEWKKGYVPLGVAREGNRLLSYWLDRQARLTVLNHIGVADIWDPAQPKISYPSLKRFSENPILKPISRHYWESKLVFNAAALKLKDKIHLIYRAVGDKDTSVFGYASSKNGLKIDERLKKPVYTPKESFENNAQFPDLTYAYESGGGGGGCEDPRITKIDDRIYMTYVAFNGSQPPGVALTSIKTDDFLKKKWRWRRPVLISPPGKIHKNWVLFPEKINGRFALLHNIFPRIAISYLKSLDFDRNVDVVGDYPFVRAKQPNCWDSWLRGVGPPPIKTDQGWLLFYHAMDDFDPGRYKLGVMLLDKQSPEKIICRSNRPLLAPDKNYENQGFKAGVVYACGAVIKNKKLLVYYGGADTVLCVAQAPWPGFVNQLINTGNPRLHPMTKPVNLIDF